ncbi:hypothetical protein BCR32DRAFT_244903 [Anaeromyces robustus]|uniref:Uncharacterized protein n=1 Tax=Anaeromyces robustus TaxID=1754192 RepID=A0A1Y1X6V4_9FUNG|nr:hypothetical protein BCR32DRAFT_244903 [Anaeromyces robustus]|eukprot:ORX81491.1 hypothetical protein BCR32DRAFT_244903 [Anaeromyces robustus]
MINNDEQFEIFDLFLSDEDSISKIFKNISEPSFIHTERDYLKLIIPNKYFIDKYLFSGLCYESVFCICEDEIIQEWVFYLYKYNYITRNDFVNFYYTGYDDMNLQFFLFEYFYYGNKKYLEELFEKSNIGFKFKILYDILIKYSYDINILKYCAGIKKYLKKRIKKRFYGSICGNKENIDDCPYRYYFIYVKEYFLSEMRNNHVIKQNYIQILYENIDKFDVYDNINLDTSYNNINILLSENKNIQKFKLAPDHRSYESILCSIDNYYNNFEFFDNLLKNPDYIFEINKYDILYDKDRQIILFYYLISLVHNNIYNEDIIDFLTSTVFFNDMYFFNNEFSLFTLSKAKHFDQLRKIFRNIPHEKFKKYIKL